MQLFRSAGLLRLGAVLLIQIACTEATVPSGVRTKGSGGAPSTAQAFGELDKTLEQRFRFMLEGAGLRRAR